MDASAVGTIDEAAFQPPAPAFAPRAAEEEAQTETETQAPEPAEDTEKRLDLYA